MFRRMTHSEAKSYDPTTTLLSLDTLDAMGLKTWSNGCSFGLVCHATFTST